jgi:hypothetical protein
MMRKLCALGICLALSLLLTSPRPAAAADDPGDALRRAASVGDLAKVKELLAAGVDANAANAYGGTALSFASDKGHAEVVKLLLEHGADVNVKDRFYTATPLLWAVEHGHAEVVRALLAKGSQGEPEALVRAAGTGKTDVVKVILERGKVGPAALTDALVASKGEDQKEIVALLEAAGAKPPVTVEVDPAVLKTYEGTYVGPNFGVTISLKDGKLVGTATDGGGTITLAPIDPVTFRGEEVPGLKVVFQIEAGKVKGLNVDQGGSTIPLTKKETP